jgi:hypothetical protein
MNRSFRGLAIVLVATMAQAAECDPMLYGMRCYNGRTGSVAGTTVAMPDADDQRARQGRISRRKIDPRPKCPSFGGRQPGCLGWME